MLLRLGEREKTRKNAKVVRSFEQKSPPLLDEQFNKYLDTVLVGFDGNTQWSDRPSKLQDFAVFSQAFPQSITSTICLDIGPSDELQIEVRRVTVKKACNELLIDCKLCHLGFIQASSGTSRAPIVSRF